MICTVVAVHRACTRSPINVQGTEYRAPPTFTWMSGPTLPVDQLASTNGVLGSGARAGASTAANTAAGAAPPNGRQARRPATSRAHRIASARICSKPVNSRPRQNESRT